MASKKKLRRNGIDNPGLRAQMDQSKIQAHNSMLTKAKLEAWLKSIVTYNAGDRDKGHYRDERRLDWDPANALVKKNVFEVSKEDRHYNNLKRLKYIDQYKIMHTYFGNNYDSGWGDKYFMWSEL